MALTERDLSDDQAESRPLVLCHLKTLRDILRMQREERKSKAQFMISCWAFGRPTSLLDGIIRSNGCPKPVYSDAFVCCRPALSSAQESSEYGYHSDRGSVTHRSDFQDLARLAPMHARSCHGTQSGFSEIIYPLRQLRGKSRQPINQ